MKKTPAETALAGMLDQLEAKVIAAVETIGRLRRENRELAERLAAAERLRQQALDKLNSIIDRLSSLR
ncbi:MAG: cell division protein ZapB [candidate division WOR-3 bacterium]